MRVRLEAKIRSAVVLEAKERLGLRVCDLCKVARIGSRDFYSIAGLDFSIANVRDKVDRLAVALGVCPDDIMPMDLEGEVIASRRVEETDLPVQEILALRSSGAVGNLLTSSPLEDLERAERDAEIRRLVETTLTQRERLALELREGGATLDVVAGRLRVSRERARQIEQKALARLRHAMTNSERSGYEFDMTGRSG